MNNNGETDHKEFMALYLALEIANLDPGKFMRASALISAIQYLKETNPYTFVNDLSIKETLEGFLDQKLDIDLAMIQLEEQYDKDN